MWWCSFVGAVASYNDDGVTDTIDVSSAAHHSAGAADAAGPSRLCRRY